jgi:aminoglycoside phosphotransferase (APT) family kinase protein
MTAAAKASDWLAAVDARRLAAWMDEQGLEQGDVTDFELLAGGTQNLIVRFRRGTRCFVLRRPPVIPRPDGDKTMVREARVLRALAESRVPHPRLIAACDDTTVLGAAFYVMEPVNGFNPSGKPLPALHASNPQWRRRMGFAMVDALLALGAIDPEQAGLADFGKPQDFLARQVSRWRAHLESYSSMPGWPGPSSLVGIEELGRRLESTRPQSFTPGLLHGDFHLANVMFAPDAPELAAVIDWELATLGDPLLDLGWLVTTWPDASGRGTGTIHVTPWDGFPTTQELVDRYRAGSLRDVSRIDWYVALASYKLAVLLEASHARACAGRTPRDVGDRHHASALLLVERGLGKLT